MQTSRYFYLLLTATALSTAGFIAAWHFGRVDTPAIAALVVLLAATWLGLAGHNLRQIGLYAGFIATVLLSLHYWPGFDQQQIWAPRRICPDCAPFSLTLYFDQLLIIAVWLPLLIGSLTPKAGMDVWLAFLATLAGSIILAMVTGLIAFDPRLPTTALLIFAGVNLVTVIAEEILFRGLLQGRILKPLGGFNAWWLTAVIFGAAHLPFAGPVFAIVAGLAGLGYGYVYWKTGSLIPAIMLHWLVNLTHFALFSYPFLV